ncbi:homeodomain-interacting protein kinase 4-like [Rhinoraja longicauda]
MEHVLLLDTVELYFNTESVGFGIPLKMSVMYSDTDAYDIIAVLGKGTFGEVTKCWKRNSDHYVAIKILRNYNFRKGVIKCELKILRMLQSVDSDKFCIVHFFESFTDDTKLCFVFELLDQNLYEYQKENNFVPLPIRHIRSITKQVLIALQKLKELSIVHTDIKPENIMLVEKAKSPFKIKLIDFGSACILPDIQKIKGPYIQSRFYRSPEILLGLPFSEKLDMWSLGCVMAELHLGWPIYPGTNEYDQIRYIVDAQGLPGDQLLETASKTHHFFKKARQPNSTYQWRLKSIDEYQAETMVQPLETRTRTLYSLDQLATVYSKTVYPDKELKAELFDQFMMVALIKKILIFDPRQRITVSTALKHPFLTMQKLKSKYKNTKYYKMSAQAFSVALTPSKKVENHYYCCQRLKQICHLDNEPSEPNQAPQKLHSIGQLTEDDLDESANEEFEKEGSNRESMIDDRNLNSDRPSLSNRQAIFNSIKLMGRMWRSPSSDQQKETDPSAPVLKGQTVALEHEEGGFADQEWKRVNVISWLSLPQNEKTEKDQLKVEEAAPTKGKGSSRSAKVTIALESNS